MFDTEFPIYGFFIIIAVLIGLIEFGKKLYKQNFEKEQIFILIIYILLGIIIGAKYFTYFSYLSYYKNNFSFLKIGLSSYGAIIGMLIMLFIFAFQFKKKISNLLYALLPSIPLMYSIGKIGCFLVGCCYGIKYDGLFSVVYYYSYSAPKGIKLFPIQLIESIVFILIYIYFFFKTKNKVANDKDIGILFIMCGLSKFLLDYLRASHINIIISINQIFSLLFIIIGLVLLYYKKNTKLLI